MMHLGQGGLEVDLILHLLYLTVLPPSNYLLLGQKKFIRHFSVELYFQISFCSYKPHPVSLLSSYYYSGWSEIHSVPVCLHLHICFLAESYLWIYNFG